MAKTKLLSFLTAGDWYWGAWVRRRWRLCGVTKEMQGTCRALKSSNDIDLASHWLGNPRSFVCQLTHPSPYTFTPHRKGGAHHFLDLHTPRVGGLMIATGNARLMQCRVQCLTESARICPKPGLGAKCKVDLPQEFSKNLTYIEALH